MQVDHYVSLRIRERRIMLGLTQQQMAALIGVTYQQAHKYETGINRISAGRLYQVAEALQVEVAYFFAGADSSKGFKSSRHQRVLLELARSFLAIPNRDQQAALCSLARTLAGVAAGAELSADAFD
jgi:transcriptional regulator with XRE-family HTH domain